MTKSTRKIIEKTLKHYDEMIEWAKKQGPRKQADEWKMLTGIGQNWFSEFCPLCLKFFVLFGCGECPLHLRYGRCGVSFDNSWKAMGDAKTWNSWIRHATLMRKQIESLLEEVKPDAK